MVVLRMLQAHLEFLTFAEWKRYAMNNLGMSAHAAEQRWRTMAASENVPFDRAGPSGELRLFIEVRRFMAAETLGVTVETVE